MHASQIVSASLLAGLMACTADSPEEIPYDNDESFVVTDFRKSLQSTEVDVVGVTIAPDTGARYLLDSERGLFEVDGTGAMILVLALADFPDPNEVLQSEFTDIAALGAQRFALTARNEGYLLDLKAHTMQRHFCYLPDSVGSPEDFYQLTHSVTFDPQSQKIYAQPQTFELNDDRAIASAIGMFGLDNGSEQAWYPLADSKFVAGAIAMAGDGQLLLARDNTITRFDFAAQVQGQPLYLDSYEIGRLAGLAVDAEAQTLLLVDSARDALLELPLSVLD